MSSGSDHDEFIDYLEDKSTNEDNTLFLPSPDGRPDSWTAFYTGILIGIVGGGLTALAPWLGGFLIAAGYGVTMLTLRGRLNRFSRALRFGFAFAAAMGAALLGSEIFFPSSAWGLIEAASEHHVIFPGVALTPWAVGMIRYLYSLLRPRRTIRQTALAK